MQAPGVQRWIERARALAVHPRLPMGASVALVALLGWQLAGLTWAALPAPDSARLPPLERPDPRGTDNAGGAGAGERLARLHLFGEAPTPEATEEPAEDATDAPETQLNLTLKGVYAAGEADGIAIISTGGEPEKVYAIGDTIAGSARITGIFEDRVVLRRNGQAETLRLKISEVAGASAAPDASGTEAQTGGGGVIERARELRNRLRQNPLELARMVRFQPYTQDGELIGFQVQPRSDEARLLEEIGISSDDVVTRINGISLDNPQQANQALRELRDARMINVTVLRDGRSRRLSLPIGEPG